MIIGITGKSGSGKSTLAKHLETIRKNTIYVDIDKIGHQVNDNENVKMELRKNFGDFIFVEGKISRKRLGNIVFNSDEAMKLLKDITWFEMKKIIEEIIFLNQDRDIILDWALLPSTELFKKCDIKILIDAPYEIRLERTIQRDNITENKFKQRESKSVDYDQFEFDFIVENVEYNQAKEKIGRLI